MANTGRRTYLPTLIKTVRIICIYSARYDATIRDNLDNSQLAAYDALRTACDAFVAITDVLVQPNP